MKTSIIEFILGTRWPTAKSLLVLASTVIFGSESHKTRDHILQFDGSGILQHFSRTRCISNSLIDVDIIWKYCN
jgi:hypothetical protein